MMTRRKLLELTAAGAGAAVLSAQRSSDGPWYRRATRWGQTNITERDPVRYDIPWWREYWKRTAVQGVIINAGG
ncbi:MAG TPA: twin-arginine translocation signal domain-containing protein, partial [Bryobacteraceae bacterium]